MLCFRFREHAAERVEDGVAGYGRGRVCDDPILLSPVHLGMERWQAAAPESGWKM